MRLLQPDVSADLESVNNLADQLQRDEVISDVKIEDQLASDLRLKSVVINSSLLSKCNFSRTLVERLQLQDCRLEQCDLTASKFAGSSWHVCAVRNTRASGLQLPGSLLKNVHFTNCKLDLANFRMSRLENVIFEGCIVTDLDLYQAKLKDVAFIDCDLENVECSAATMKNVDLTRARIVSIKGLSGLKGAHISSEQLVTLAPYFAQEFGLIVKE